MYKLGAPSGDSLYIASWERKGGEGEGGRGGGGGGGGRGGVGGGRGGRGRGKTCG